MGGEKHEGEKVKDEKKEGEKVERMVRYRIEGRDEGEKGGK